MLRLVAGNRSSAVEVPRERVERPAAGEREHRAALLLRALLVGVVGDVLAEPLLAAALEVDRGRQAARTRRRDRAAASLERVGVDLERADRRERHTGPWACGQYRPADPRRCRVVTEALRFWALIEVIGLGAAPLAGVLLARLPGAGLGLGKLLGLLLVVWLVWIGGSTTLVPVRRRSAPRCGSRSSARSGCSSGCAGGRGAARSRAGSRAAGSPAGAGAGSRRARPSPTRVRTRLFWGAEAVFAVAFAGDGAARRLLARRLAHREADGHGVPRRVQPRGHVPARGPVARRRRPQLLLPRPPRDGGARQAHRGRARPGLQPRRRGAVRAHRDRRVHARAGRCGRRPRGSAGAVRAGLARGRARARARQPRGRAPADRRRRAAARLRLVRARAHRPGHDHRVPVVLVPARRPARARAGAAVHAARARVRAAGRARRAAAGAPRTRVVLEACVVALAVGFLYAVNSWSYPVMAGPARARRRRVAARPAQRADAARRRALAARGARAQRAARAPVPPVVRPGRARDRRRRRGPRLRAAGCATSCCCSARSPCSSRSPTSGGCSRRAGRCATRSGSRSPRCSPARCSPRSTTRTSRCWLALLLVALQALLAADVPPPQRLVWLLVAAASRACSGRSCSTSATSSTAARCTG